MPKCNLIAVTALDASLQHYAVELARSLKLPLVENDISNPSPVQYQDRRKGRIHANFHHQGEIHYQYLLTLKPVSLTEYRLELVTNNRPSSTICVDFLAGATGYRLRQAKSVIQPLAKAVGLKHGVLTRVIDATVGLGRDAGLLASLGCSLHMIEKSPVIAQLLNDGLRRLALLSEDYNDISKRMHLTIGNAERLIPAMSKDNTQVIYLDPMYPKSANKSALVKKEMRAVRDIVGDDSDIESLLAIALKYAQQRVVVKRPISAPLVSGPQPSHAIQSKNTRYDVYLIHGN